MKRTNQSCSPIKLAWRIGFPKCESAAAFAQLLKFLKQHPSVVDEVALFESATHHLYIPLDVIDNLARDEQIVQSQTAATCSTHENET